VRYPASPPSPIAGQPPPDRGMQQQRHARPPTAPGITVGQHSAGLQSPRPDAGIDGAGDDPEGPAEVVVHRPELSGSVHPDVDASAARSADEPATTSVSSVSDTPNSTGDDGGRPEPRRLAREQIHGRQRSCSGVGGTT
jgi:hypothetical protein